MKRYNPVLALAALLAVPALAVQFGDIVDLPTAGLQHRGAYAVNLRMQPEGGLIMGFSVGLFDRLNLGLSYGGIGIIGYGNPDWYPYPSIQAKYRLFEESYMGPAVVLGFDNQGFGRHSGDAPSRYLVKSRGFYAVASKNFRFLGTLALHGGANYSLEERNGPDNPVSAFCGFEKSLNPELSVIAEYDFAFNDDIEDHAYGEGHGYLNAGVRWVFSQKMMLEFDLRNITRNGPADAYYSRMNRTVKIAYLDSF